MKRVISGKRDATQETIVDLSQQISGTPHVFVGYKFLDSSNNVVTPSAGTFSFTVKCAGMEIFEDIVGGVDIDATFPLSSLNFSANADALKYTPSGIIGADDIEITVIGNNS